MSQIDHNWPFPCAGNAWVSAKSEEFRFRNRENADSIGALENKLMYMCARCRRSVSLEILHLAEF